MRITRPAPVIVHLGSVEPLAWGSEKCVFVQDRSAPLCLHRAVKLDRLHHRGTGQRTHNIVFNKRSREFEDYRARCDFNSVNRSGGITKGAKQNSSILCIPLPRPQQLLLHQLERELKVQHRCSYVASNRMTSFQDSRFPSICVLKAEAARARSHLCCSASSKEAGRDAALAGISGCAFVQDCRACYFNEEGHACRAAAHGCCC